MEAVINHIITKGWILGAYNAALEGRYLYRPRVRGSGVVLLWLIVCEDGSIKVQRDIYKNFYNVIED